MGDSFVSIENQEFEDMIAAQEYPCSKMMCHDIEERGRTAPLGNYYFLSNAEERQFKEVPYY
jgi:hypothetical protein